MILLVVLIVWLTCAIAGNSLGESRKMGATMGTILGLLLGVIGLVIVALSEKIYAEQNDKSVEAESHLSAVDELKKWYDLKMSGAITEEEFAQKKKRLL